MGTPQHLGVVGVAVFREVPPPPPPPQPVARGTWGDMDEAGSGPSGGAAKNAPKAEAAPTDDRSRQNLGTQYGETRHSAVVDVPFRRRDGAPDALLALYYDDRAGLARRGVVATAPVFPVGPQPFPDSPGQFAPPPPR